MTKTYVNRGARLHKFWKSNFVLAMAIFVMLGVFTSARAEPLATLSQHTHYHGIAFNRAGSAALLLATHHGLFAVDKDGEATLVSEIHDYMGFSVDPSDALSYYGSGHPAAGGNSGVLRSRDGGATWNMISAGAGGPVDFHQMDVSLADPATIYGNYGALQVSHDGGHSWAVSGELPEKTITIATSSVSAARLFAASEDGLFVSEDFGQNWVSAGFAGQVVSTVRTGSDGIIYVFVLGQGLMESKEDELGQWKALSNAFGESIPLHMAIDSSTPLRLALTAHDQKVFLSDNGGLDWHILGEVTP